MKIPSLALYAAVSLLALGAYTVFFPAHSFAQDDAGAGYEVIEDEPAMQPEPLNGWSVIPEEQPDVQREYTGPELFSLAEESYNNGEYEKARDAYVRALELLEDPQVKARAHERLAFIYAAFDLPDKVYEEFVESLTLYKGLQLDQDIVSPKVYEAYMRARDQVIREGVLVVNCDPPGAEVYINGELIGEAPLRKSNVEVGTYELMLRKFGYETSTGSVVIKKDYTLTVDEKMVEASGVLEVSSEPPGVQVSFDGRPVGATPVRVERVSGGSHTLGFKREYFEPQEAEVQADKAGHSAYRAVMKRRILVVRDTGSDAAEASFYDAVSGMEGLSVATVGIGELEKDMRKRGLDPASLGFLKERKDKITLEDYAALSGVMEDAHVELALICAPSPVKDGVGLNVSLYSTASEHADNFGLYTKDLDGFVEKVDGFKRLWREVANPSRYCIGARVVERESGGLEILDVTPGLPAAEAGMKPGDTIVAVDGTRITTNPEFKRAALSGGAHAFTYVERGKEMDTKIEPVECSVEVPVVSGGYLYNLALVDNAGYLENVPAGKEGPDDARGLAALSLGNVWLHLGEYKKAVEAYKQAHISGESGVCSGTALYRMGQAYENLGQWPEAANAYRQAMMLYPGARTDSAEGTPVAPLARERLVRLYELGLVLERWWM